MKKIYTFLITFFTLVTLNSLAFATINSIPVNLIEVTGLDAPFTRGTSLDTKVDISDKSFSNFKSLKWHRISDSEYKVVIETAPAYYTFYYTDDVKATINGKEAVIEEFNPEESKNISFSYTFQNVEMSSSTSDKSLIHVISVLYMKNGKILPNPIRAKHKMDCTVQIIPDEGYEVKDVEVDGESVGAVTEYTFKTVKETHKIKAYFKPIEGYTPDNDESPKSEYIIKNKLTELVSQFTSLLKIFGLGDVH